MGVADWGRNVPRWGLRFGKDSQGSVRLVDGKLVSRKRFFYRGRLSDSDWGHFQERKMILRVPGW